MMRITYNHTIARGGFGYDMFEPKKVHNIISLLLDILPKKGKNRRKS